MSTRTPTPGDFTLPGRLLARNAVLNLVGHALPLAVALLAIPLLVSRLGTDRFGILTLAWVLIGYLGIFDLGLGRALTQLAAEQLGRGRRRELPQLFWTASALMLAFGAVGALVFALATPWLVTGLLEIPAGLHAEAAASFYVLALALPFVTSTTGFRGILEATQSFGLVNALRVPLSAINYLGPLLVLPFTDRLVPVVVVLLVGRLVGWAAHFVACLVVLPELRRVRLGRRHARRLVGFGGWMTISNLISPLMHYADRFLIGALVSVTAVAYYVTAYEVVSKLVIIPTALLGVLFPAFAAFHASGPERLARLYSRGVRIVVLLVFPLALVLMVLAREGLTLWLGAEFARHGVPVLQWLAVGVFANAVAQVPYSVVQGAGRPDVTAKLHVAELPFYLLAIWLFSAEMGLTGVAVAWTLRAVVDALALFFAAERLLPSEDGFLRRTALLLGSTALLFGAAVPLSTGSAKLLYLAAVIPAFILVAWKLAMDAGERAALLRLVGSRGEAGDLIAR